MNTSPRVWAAIIATCVFLPAVSFGQETSKIEQQQRQIDREEQLRERIEEKKAPAPIEKTPELQTAPLAGEEKAFIKKIEVDGVTLLSQDEVTGIIAPYENRELTLADMQKVIDRITDAYRTKGYVTSKGYLPPQKIQDGFLKIRAIEGTTGKIDVTGNRYYSSKLLRSYIQLEPGAPFNYNDLKKSLAKINEYPDRRVKAVLVPGSQPGSTDIVLETADKLPIHLGIDYDNYASRYIGRNRYTGTLTHNNLLGLDDSLSLKYQSTDNQNYELGMLRYIFPMTRRLKLGVFFADSRLELQKEFKVLEARGKSKVYELFGTYELLTTDKLRVFANAGFEYLNSYNFQRGAIQSRDRLRVGKFAADIDYSDSWGGRNIFTPELAFGFADLFNGMANKDPLASRSGARANFCKESFSYLRLQSMPFSSTLLWKNFAQFSSYILPAPEQFQLGGISNVRGYPSGELSGDQGYSTSFEWTVPPYGLARDLKVPFSTATFYDSLRFAAFFDWGYARVKRPQAGEAKHKSIDSIGVGIRFNLPEDFSIRADFAWALAKKPSDGDSFHPWIAVSKQF